MTGAYIQPCTPNRSLSRTHHLPLAACQHITKHPAACRATAWASCQDEGLDPGVHVAPHQCNLGHGSRSERQDTKESCTMLACLCATPHTCTNLKHKLIGRSQPTHSRPIIICAGLWPTSWQQLPAGGCLAPSTLLLAHAVGWLPLGWKCGSDSVFQRTAQHGTEQPAQHSTAHLADALWGCADALAHLQLCCLIQLPYPPPLGSPLFVIYRPRISLRRLPPLATSVSHLQTPSKQGSSEKSRQCCW